MSDTISTALKNRQPVFLVEIEISDDVFFTYGTEQVSLDDRNFRGLILNQMSIGKTFSFESLRYSYPTVEITMANQKDDRGLRLSDYESILILDGRPVKIYIWADGLTWSDISTDGLIHEGVFSKKRHNNDYYAFDVISNATKVYKIVPDTLVDQSTWPDHKAASGGLPQPIAFGDLAKIPLYNVDTAAYKYLAVSHPIESTDADYTAATENVYDKDDNVITAGGYTMTTSNDGEGNTVTLFDFTADQASLEPLSCSMRGVVDAGAEYTDAHDTLIEHPRDITYWMLRNHSDILDSGVDKVSFGSMKESFYMRCASYIKSECRADEYIDRILFQCCTARTTTVGGKLGVVTFDFDPEPVKYINRNQHCISQKVDNGNTKDHLVCNDLWVKYAKDWSTNAFTKVVRTNEKNSAHLKLSKDRYGSRKKIIECPDLLNESDALVFSERYLEIFSFRHNLLHNFDVPYNIGWNLNEGDCIALTLQAPEGQSRDGSYGWVDEKCLVIEKKYLHNVIRLTLWRIDIDMNYSGQSEEGYMLIGDKFVKIGDDFAKLGDN
jgi:hypothetical protein